MILIKKRFKGIIFRKTHTHTRTGPLYHVAVKEFLTI